MDRRLRETLFGLVAIVLWSLLALLTAASGAIAPFQLAAICFGIASLIGLTEMRLSGAGFGVLAQPPVVWLLGVGGLFGYHFFYFTALRHAPPVEAGLIAYLWPLLIVVFSALLPGERLKAHHLLGAFIGFCGALLIISRGGQFSFQAEHGFGYLSAGLCAIIWSTYSVLSRRFDHVPSQAVTGFCVGSCLLAIVAHFLFEQTVWPDTIYQWIAILALGAGPVGLAFYVWDHGVKHGHIQLLGVASYAAPVLSTLALVVSGYAPFTWTIAVATLMVSLGAVIAAKDMILRSDPA